MAGVDLRSDTVTRPSAQMRAAMADAEVLALWTEETFRDSVDPVFLARACAEIRRRGTVAS